MRTLDPAVATMAERRVDPTGRAMFQLHQRLDEGERRMDLLEASVQANTELTQAVKADTAAIVEIAHSLSEAFKVLRGIGAVARPISYIAAAVAAGLAAWGAWSNRGH